VIGLVLVTLLYHYLVHVRTALATFWYITQYLILYFRMLF